MWYALHLALIWSGVFTTETLNKLGGWRWFIVACHVCVFVQYFHKVITGRKSQDP